MNNEPVKVAIMYDFDRTLCTKDMQEFAFIPSIGMESREFWREANLLGRQNRMDGVLAYMYLMIKKSAEKGIPVDRESLKAAGGSVCFYEGVESWFKRIVDFGKTLNAQVEHYVISSGLKEIIEGTSIAGEFTEIFACEFLYDEQGRAVWPVTAVNYTNKTQFVYRINKGVLDVSNDLDLNKSTPDDSKRIPFVNMIYIGDGLSDVPCMKMMKSYGGSSIAVYESLNEKVEELLKKGRADYIFPADYRENSGLENTVKNIIRKIVISQTLFDENKKQLGRISRE